MVFKKAGFLGRFKWQLVIIYLITAAIVAGVLFTNIFETTRAELFSRLVWFFGGIVLLSSIFMIFAKISEMMTAINENGKRIEKINGSLEKIWSITDQVNQNTRISESAKSIAFRDADKRVLREAVFDKLQRKDFEATYEIIDEIANSTVYKRLASKLREEADSYRTASDQEQVNQIIAHISKLIEDHQWVKASALIERLIQSEPSCERAKLMRQKLVDSKQERKKILLNAWDDAVKRQATDRSLEILKELDSYLSPNEALALQEAALDIFRTKLHNLGVQFSLAVSEKQWVKALKAGQQIIHNFPNSRMADEIRSKVGALQDRVEQQL